MSIYFRDVVRIYVFFFFSYFRDTLFLHCDSKPCTCWYIYIYTFEDVITVLSPIFTCVVYFFLYTHVSYILYAIYYFYFTLRCRDEFCLKCFKNTGCQSLLAINSHLAKFFKSLCIGYILLYSTSEYELSDLWLLSYLIYLLWFCHRLSNGEIVRTYVEHVKNICHLELANPLTKRTLLVIR